MLDADARGSSPKVVSLNHRCPLISPTIPPVSVGLCFHTGLDAARSADRQDFGTTPLVLSLCDTRLSCAAQCEAVNKICHDRLIRRRSASNYVPPAANGNLCRVWSLRCIKTGRETFGQGQPTLAKESERSYLDNPQPRRASALTARSQEAGSRTSEVRDSSIPSVSVNSPVALPQEHFVDASVAAEYLHCSRKHILRLSRNGVIPAFAISFGRRVTWRYLLSELRAWVLGNRVPATVATTAESGRRMASGSPRKGGR